MPEWQRRYVVGCCAIIGFALAYVLCDFGMWPRLTYFPYEREFHFVTDPGSIPSNYLGMVLWGLGGALVAGVLATLAVRRVKLELPRTWVRLFGAWALTSFALAGGYFTWNLWPF